MNYWDEKTDFWNNKTRDNEIYEKQKLELVRDLKKIIKEKKITRVVDVGGHKGIVGTMLPDGIEYINLDFRTGVDISRPWQGQKGMKTFEKKKGTLIFTSLALICLPPEALACVLSEIRKFGDVFYFYEEAFSHEKHHDAQQLSNDYGGKWIYDWERLFKPWGLKNFEKSIVNQNWVRIS